MKQKTVRFIVVHIPLIFVTIVTLVPFLLTFVVSFSDERSVLVNGYSFFPDSFSAYAYRYVLADDMIYRAYLVTICVTAVGTLLSVFLCAMAGYAMSVQKLRHRNKIAMYFYIPMVFQVSLVPWYLVVTNVLMLKNNLLALVVPLLIVPFYIFLLRNYFSTIPPSLAESAEIDGASQFQIFIRIIFPLGIPIIATVTLFVALKYWNDWTMALWFIDKREYQPLQFMLFRIKSLIDYLQRSSSARTSRIVPTETVQAATLFVTIGPIILMYPFVQKYFIKGIMIGAVKG